MAAAHPHPPWAGTDKKAEASSLAAAVFGAGAKPHLVHQVVSAEARRPRRYAQRGAAAWSRVAAPSRGGRRAQVGHVPERPGRRNGRAEVWRSPAPQILHAQGQPEGAQGGVRGALSAHVKGRQHWPCGRRRVRGAPTRAPSDLLAAWGKELPLVVVAEPDEDVDQVFPQPRPRARGRAGRARGRRAGLGAARCSSPRPRSTRVEEVMGSMSLDPARSDRSGRLREELQPDRGQQVLVPGPSEGPQDRRSARPSRSSSTSRSRASTSSRFSPSRSGAAFAQRHEAGLEESDRPAARGRPDRDLRRRHGLDAHSEVQADEPWPALPQRLDLRGGHEVDPGEEPARPVKRTGGRNNKGRITTRHQGGGHKRRYRVVDFKRTKDGVPAKVAAIEYDPNRSARIALLHYADGAKSYILAPARLQVGQKVESGPNADIRPGQRAAAREHPDRHARPQRRAEAWQGRPDGA